VNETGILSLALIPFRNRQLNFVLGFHGLLSLPASLPTSAVLKAVRMPIANVQAAGPAEGRKAIALHEDHQAGATRNNQPTLPAARDALSEWIAAWHEQIVVGEGRLASNGWVA
jgi:hypothetical protein